MRSYMADMKRHCKECGYELDILNEKDNVFGNVNVGLWKTIDNGFILSENEESA